MSKQCIQCHKEIKNEAQFCPYCGSKQDVLQKEVTLQQDNHCIKCGKVIKEGVKFCPYCGSSQIVETPVEEPMVEETPVTEEPVQEDNHCIKCGKVIKEGAKFCPYCGSSQTVETPVEEPTVEEEPAVEEAPTIEEPMVEETPAVEEPVQEDNHCIKCGKVIKEGAKFCPYCGSSQTVETPVEEPTVEEEPAVEETPTVEEPMVEETPVTEEPVQEDNHCIKCGKVIKEGAKFCPYCGSSQTVEMPVEELAGEEEISTEEVSPVEDTTEEEQVVEKPEVEVSNDIVEENLENEEIINPIPVTPVVSETVDVSGGLNQQVINNEDQLDDKQPVEEEHAEDVKEERHCIKCGRKLKGDAKFCPYCGTNQEGKNKKCIHCGKEVSPQTKFCPYCGKPQDGTQNPHHEETPDIKAFAKDSFEKVTDSINNKMGEEGKANVHIKDLFAEVFNKHTEEDRDLIFACGSKATTPKESEIMSEWPRPWLYSRILVGLLLVSFVLYVMVSNFQNPNAIPGLIMVGSTAFPLSVLIFYWEMNAPRNISFYQVLKIFLIGGVFSLLCTLVIYEIAPEISSMTYTDAMIIGVIEEIGKLVVVAYFVNKLNSKYILNGLLIGGAIGAGFAAFESAGYALNYASSVSSMVSLIELRGLLAIGGHVAWAAISGAALVAVKRDQKLTGNMFGNTRFLFFLILVIVLHGLWDSPLTIGSSVYTKFIILCIIPWIVILSQISAGLKQVEKISKKAKEQEQNDFN